MTKAYLDQALQNAVHDVQNNVMAATSTFAPEPQRSAIYDESVLMTAPGDLGFAPAEAPLVSDSSILEEPLEDGAGLQSQPVD